MDLDKRRQHVNRALANLGEGSSIPTTSPGSEAEVVKLPPSFTYVPPEEAPMTTDELNELRIPMGAPSLFEETSAEAPVDTREIQPSPLDPHEVNHALAKADSMSAPAAGESLEGRFIRAINGPESASSANPEVVTGLDTPPVEELGVPLDTAAVASQPIAESASLATAAPHPDHFTESAPVEVIEEQGSEDAGLGAKLMAERQTLIQHQEQEAG